MHNFREVDHPVNPGEMIAADFRQAEDAKPDAAVQQGRQFDLEILWLERNHFNATSSLPIRENAVRIHEMWSEPILMVVLKNAKLIDSNAGNVSDLIESKSKKCLD